MKVFPVKLIRYSLILVIFIFSGCDSRRDEYFPDGKLKIRQEIDSVTGVLDGKRFEYAASGHLRSIVTYKDNKQDGKQCLYYETGRLKQVLVFRRPTASDPSFKENGNIPILENSTKYFFSVTSRFPNLINWILPNRLINWMRCTSAEESFDDKESVTEYDRSKPQKTTIFDRSGRITNVLWYTKWGEAISQKAVQHARSAQTYLTQKKYSEALEEARKFLTVAPDSSQGYVLLGSTLDAKGELQSAIEAYRKAVIINNHNAEAFTYLGRALAQNGNWAEGEESLNTAIKIEPKALRYESLSLIQQNLKKYVEAYLSLQKAAEIEPQNGRIQSKIGGVLELLNEREKALNAFRKAVQYQPDDGGILLKFAEFLLKIGNKEEGFLQLSKAVTLLKQINPDSPKYELSRLYLKSAYWNIGDINSSVETSLIHYREDPVNISSTINLAIVADDIGERELAIELLRSTIEHGATNATLHYNLAEALFLDHKIDEAVIELKTAVSLNSNNQDFLALLGKGLILQGKMAEAQEQLNAALKLDPLSALAHQQLVTIFKAGNNKLEARRHLDLYAQAIEKLSDDLQNPDPKVHRVSTWKLGMVAAEDSSVGQVLAIALDDNNNFVKINALWALALMGTEAQPQTGQIVKLLDDSDPWVRRRALLTLIDVSKFEELPQAKKEFVVLSLIDDLKNSQPLVRRNACTILSKLGAYAKRSLTTLATLVDDDEKFVSQRAKEAMATLKEIE